MRVNRIALSLVVAAGLAVQGVASAQENRGTMEQQMACTPDVWRLCFDQIPDAGRITACLRQNTPQLSGGCREVFESNASAQQQTAQTVPQPRRRQVQPQVQPHVQTQPRVYEVQPAPRDDDDQ
jgi:hypothetical protein